MEEQKQESLKDIMGHVKEYLTTHLQLIKLELTAKSAELLASLSMKIISFFVFLFLTLFISLALASFIEKVTGNAVYGYLGAAAFYILILIILALLKKSLLIPKLTDFFVKELLKKNENERN